MTSKMEIFKCEVCGNSVLEYKGKALFANIIFDCFRCEKCGNKILSEQKSGHFEDIKTKSVLISTNFN